ncbi:MAG: ZIP family metal transporter [Limnochordaceae bacterium]|nr:ZIP family metal transporter [Limnochordaceae bacterium]
MQVVWASLAAGLATAVGALPAVAFARLPEDVRSFAMGVSAGVMTVVSIWGLGVPALSSGPGAAAGGLFGGTAAMWGLDRLVRRAVLGQGRQTPPSARRQHARRALLLWTAIVLHNIPEGLAVGAAYAAPIPVRAAMLAVSIGAHNLPEGLAVAVPLRAAGAHRWLAWAAAAAAGLVEPLAAATAYLTLVSAPGWLPAAHAGAAAAMLYVVATDMLPELEAKPFPGWGAVGAGLGLAAALAVEVWAGGT